ncbi:hypothetical protein FYK55_00910 [Roseiconus nitratireducens]|uniref:Uncharacterized protein n=1 Tax=Roseiconus nitratireducens TaxID=2605748 RepID=A0A5M6DLK3_9BACT|nr:hypothetical protein [Roseiconus nitratireducens]KAA5547010.1 hypothetical protein FYK55_00910 [Roseiconus nitratireducens]
MKMPKPDGGDYEPCPAGNQLAVCARLIDLGTQSTTYAGKPKRQRKLYIEFQVPGERTADDQPFVVGNRYTFSSSERATLRQHLESWRGRRFTNEEIEDFDLRNILNKPACLSIVHNERGGNLYADIAHFSGIPKGTSGPALEGPTTYLSLDPEDFDPEVFEALSDRLKETIAASPEYQALTSGATTSQSAATQPTGPDDENIPF